MFNSSEPGNHKMIKNNCTLINETTLAIGKSEAIAFINLDSGQLSFHYATNQSNDDIKLSGVSCVAGNKCESIIAVADISTKPHILLFTYPQLKCISKLRSTLNISICLTTTECSNNLYFLDQNSYGFYKQLEFWESEHLVALSFYDNFFIEIWNWRNGALLLTQKTNYLVNNHFI